MSDVFVHESAVVDENVTIGKGSKIWHFCHISSGATLGEGCVLGQNVFVAPNVKIGSGVKIQNNVSLYVGVEVDDDVFLGPSCVFTNVINPRAHIERKDEFKATRVRRGVSVGANATIVCGVELGEYTMVGAGAVVTRDTLPHALLVGIPARQVGWACQCGQRLQDSEAPTCTRCAATYSILDGRCTRSQSR